jgi:cysteine-rich repeat protein
LVVLLSATLEHPAIAATPHFISSLAPFGLTNDGEQASPELVDLDGDGDLDAFVGVWNGLESTLFLYENTGTARAPAFAAPKANPFGLSDVDAPDPNFGDLDGDGDLDGLIGSADGHMLFFENTGTAQAPIFAAPQFEPFGLVAFAGNLPAPTFADLDGDGDLDVWASKVFGHIVVFENTGTPKAPAFAAPQTEPFGLADIDSAFASPAFGDVDGDGDVDVLIGSLERTFFFENLGSATAPSFAAAQVDPLGIARRGVEPSPTLADLDGDGDLDALIGYRDGSVLFFENTGTANAPAFAAPPPPFFSLGPGTYGASPGAADLDDDGDLDGLLGGGTGRHLLYFQNTGTPETPAFAEGELDAFGLDYVSYPEFEYYVAQYLSPTFADLDDDGDLDVLVGTDLGDTFLFENQGSPTAPAFADPVANPFGLANVGHRASPAFADLDADGDLDSLVSGTDIDSDTGSLSFFENTGAANAPSFAAPQTNPFGLGTVDLLAWPTFADLDGDGDLDAWIGRWDGNTHFFENTGTPQAPAFAKPRSNPFGLTDVGMAASPEFADLDADGDLDLLMGELHGSTRFFENAPCGDSRVEGVEECDDGNDVAGDGCSARCRWVECPDAPEPACKAEFRGATLLVDERRRGRERLVARLTQGPALAAPDFGAPLSANGAAYALCVYDEAGSFAGAVEVKRAGDACGDEPCWRALGRRKSGYLYEDDAGKADGIRVLELSAGRESRSRISLSAYNRQARRQTDLPKGLAVALETAAGAVLQLHTSDSGCFSAVLEHVVRQEEDLFKARSR